MISEGDTFAYDYENRLTSIAGSGLTATFLYDADGQRVKGVVNGVSTVYVAGMYEYQAGATTLYYDGNAIRRSGYASDNGTFYLLQDHLKSSSAFVIQGGVVNSRNYFYPFGGNRGGTAFSSLTTKRFTGQYHEAGLPGGEGLSYYGARWYDAKLGRFLSADTIVPGPANPQAFNRYSYVLNNPLQYRDPSGHMPQRSLPMPIPPVDLKSVMAKLKSIWKMMTDPYVAPLYQAPQAAGPAYYALYREKRDGKIPEALALTRDWYWEQGGRTRTFNSSSAITRFLQADEGVTAARRRFLDNSRHDLTGNNQYDYRFKGAQYARETQRTIRTDEWSGSFLGGVSSRDQKGAFSPHTVPSSSYGHQ